MSYFYSNLPIQRETGLIDSELTFRNQEDGALSASLTTAGLVFGSRNGMSFQVKLLHPAITGVVPGTAEWQAALEISPDGTTYTQLASTVLSDTEGSDLIVGTAEQAARVLGPKSTPSKDWARLVLTKVGSPGDLSITAYIVN